MFRQFQMLLAFLSLVLIGACAGTPTNTLSKVHAGMDKADVLEFAGNPDKVDRAHGHDRWHYTTSTGEPTYVFFREGKVQYVGPEFPTKPYPESKKEKTGESKPSGTFKDIEN